VRTHRDGRITQTLYTPPICFPQELAKRGGTGFGYDMVNCRHLLSELLSIAWSHWFHLEMRRFGQSNRESKHEALNGAEGTEIDLVAR
jgi:hypothetical protein